MDAVVDLTGAGATRLGAADSVNGDARRELTQAWARAITLAWPTVDGFWHRSAMDGGDRLCLVRGPSADGASALPDRPALSLPLAAAEVLDLVDVAAQQIGYAVDV